MLFRVLAAVAIAASFGGVAAQARTIKQLGGPAELPPAGFKGDQFVDSRGCLFMRAGYGGDVSWVPRATRDRQVMCGYKPTFAKDETRPVTPAPKPKQLEIAAAKPASTPAPKPAAKPAKAEAPMQTVATTTVPPRIHAAKRVAAAPAPKPAAPARTSSGPSIKGVSIQLVDQTQCDGLTRVMRVATLDDGRRAVRCGGQSATPGGDYTIVRVAKPGSPLLKTAAAAPAPAPMPAPKPVAAPAAKPAPRAATTTIIVPAPKLAPAPQSASAPVAVASAAPLMAPTVPKGYKPAWSDGRLNPQRGRGTAQGDAEMSLVWTQTVPRKLIDTRSGNTVNKQYPWLGYPVTARPPQPTGSKKWVRVQPNTSARLSTSNAPTSMKAPTASPATVQGYVQVGSFGVPANASRTAARLQAMGLPVHIGKMTSGGRQLQVVMAGPFADRAALASALGRTRRAGFRDAFIRR